MSSHSTSSANERRICAVNVSPSNTMRPHSSVTRSVRWYEWSWLSATYTAGPIAQAPA